MKPAFGCVAGIEASLGCERFPGRALADLCGKPLVQRLYERTRAASLVDEAYVLTTQDAVDDPLVEALQACRIPFRRGPRTDVLERYLALVAEAEPNHIVRIEAGRAFVDPDYIDLQLGALRAFDGDVVRVAGDDGSFEDVIGGQLALSVRALRWVQASEDEQDRAQVGAAFLRRHGESLRQVEIEVDPRLLQGKPRLSVDGPEDLEPTRTVWRAIDHEGDGLFPVGRAVRWIHAHPESWKGSSSCAPGAPDGSFRGPGSARRVA